MFARLSLEAKWSRPNEEALTGLGGIYDDEVMYFGKRSTRDEVIKEKRAFARKFPERDYRPKEPVSVWCSEHICTVRGVLDFRSVDAVAQIVSEGVASSPVRCACRERARNDQRPDEGGTDRCEVRGDGLKSLC